MANRDLVDDLAGQAMHAILTTPELMEAVTKMGSQAVHYEEALKAIARKSYDIAQAMLVERTERRRSLAEETAFRPDKPIV